MNAVLLIVFICISYLIVRIGAIAPEMTGMQRARARFQALSAFSGTGFTTREAELVVNHPRRRKHQFKFEMNERGCAVWVRPSSL